MAKSFTYQSEYNWMPFAYSIANENTHTRGGSGFFWSTFNSSRRYATRPHSSAYFSQCHDSKMHICGSTHQFDCKYSQNAYKRLHSYIEFCANVKMWNKVCKQQQKKAHHSILYFHVLYFTLFEMNFETFLFERNSHCQSYLKRMHTLMLRALSIGIFLHSSTEFFLINKQCQ